MENGFTYTPEQTRKLKTREESDRDFERWGSIYAQGINGVYLSVPAEVTLDLATKRWERFNSCDEPISFTDITHLVVEKPSGAGRVCLKVRELDSFSPHNIEYPYDVVVKIENDSEFGFRTLAKSEEEALRRNDELLTRFTNGDVSVISKWDEFNLCDGSFEYFVLEWRGDKPERVGLSPE